MGATRANKNRAIRQENLREWLSEKCTAQHLVDNIIKIESLDSTSETFRNDLDKYKVANEQRLKVMNKYLPDVRTVELTGEAGGAIQTDNKYTIEFVNADSNPLINASRQD